MPADALIAGAVASAAPVAESVHATFPAERAADDAPLSRVQLGAQWPGSTVRALRRTVLAAVKGAAAVLEDG